MATAREIDEAILANVTVHWAKVALVVWNALRQLKLPDTDGNLDALESRIKALAQEGRIQSQGDLAKPRHSEVRLPKVSGDA